MKKLFFLTTCAVVCTVLSAQTTDLLLEEDFEYEAPRVLISDPIDGSDNLDAVTGWSTAANSSASINTFDIVEGNLSYPGYVGGQFGNSLAYNGEAGQSVFKLFPEGICDGKTVYVAFMLNIAPTTEEITGGDFMFSLKMEPQADSWNWGGRLYAKVDPSYIGEEITFGIQKLSDCNIQWVNGQTGPFFPVGQTLLVVIKYYVGAIYGNNQDEEAGHFDDEMYLYINPSLSAEPATADISLIDRNAKDIYRWGTTKIFGSARGIYLRSADHGTIPAYTIDGIRAGRTWEEVIGYPEDTENIQTNTDNNKYIDKDGQIIIRKGARRYSVLGIEL